MTLNLKILSRLLARYDWLDAEVVAGDAVDQALGSRDGLQGYLSARVCTAT
jgi:hypothetical protein